MTTLAEYNNNPGNIRPAKGVKYEGMIGVDDKGFAIFEKPEYGQKALVDDITHKIEKRGIKTPNDFVDIYSPKGDENSEDARDNYKIYIAQKLGLKSTSDPFPENAVEKLSQAITNFEGGKWQEKAEEKKEDAKDESGEGDGKTIPASTAAGAAENVIMGGIGAATGAQIAGSIETGKKALPLIQSLYNKATGSTEYMNKPQSRASLQRYLNSQIAPDLRVPLKELEKVAGGKSVRTMSEVQDALAYIKEVPEQKITKPVYKPQAYGSKTLIDTGKVTPTTIPGRPAVDLSAYKHNPTVLTRAADQAVQAGEMVKGALPSVARVGVGALGGALAGSQLYDAFEQYKKEGQGLHMPSARNAAQFASGAGGALSMLPFGVTQGVGLALQAPELAYQGYEGLKALNERRKSATKEDTDRMLMNVDLMGNPMP
jgi:hypothetical protein